MSIIRVIAMSRINKRVNRLYKRARRQGPKALPRLVALLQDRSPTVRRAAVQMLGQLGVVEAIPDMLPLLRDADRGVRYTTAQALGWLRNARAVPRLLRSLNDEDPGVRGMSVMALGWIGDVRAIPGLLNAMSDLDYGVRHMATGVLSQLCGRSDAQREGWKLLLPPLLDTLLTGDGDMRLASAHVLSCVDEYGAEVLFDALYVRSGVNGSSVWALNRTGVQAIHALVVVLRHTRDAEQQEMIQALLGRIIEPVVPLLLDRLLDKRAGARNTAYGLFKAIGGGVVLPLKRALKSDSSERRIAAATMLGQIGEPSLPALLEVLHDEDPHVRELCVRPLLHIGSPAVPHLLDELLAEESNAQHLVAQILDTMVGLEANSRPSGASLPNSNLLRAENGSVESVGPVCSLQTVLPLARDVESLEVEESWLIGDRMIFRCLENLQVAG